MLTLGRQLTFWNRLSKVHEVYPENHNFCIIFQQKHKQHNFGKPQKRKKNNFEAWTIFRGKCFQEVKNFKVFIKEGNKVNTVNFGIGLWFIYNKCTSTF